MPHALISGGSSGIGLKLAEKLFAKGWNVSLIARDKARLQQAQSAIDGKRQSSRQLIQTFSADVTDGDAVVRAVRAATSTHPLDLVVSSAGIIVPGSFADLPPDAFDRTMKVNYLGTVNLVRAVLPDLRARGEGRIVLISSGAGLIGLYGYTAYAPSKFAVRGFAEALRAELRPEGIGVSIVYPPDTDTPQLRAEIPARPAATSRIVARAKVLSAEAVADAILRGIARQRFAIAPGPEMKLLAALHSLISPLLNRLLFDPAVADELRKKASSPS